ncbi:hypothetical protein HZS_5456, partial [Henneguya salminicola]
MQQQNLKQLLRLSSVYKIIKNMENAWSHHETKYHSEEMKLIPSHVFVYIDETGSTLH